MLNSVGTSVSLVWFRVLVIGGFCCLYVWYFWWFVPMVSCFRVWFVIWFGLWVLIVWLVVVC